MQLQVISSLALFPLAKKELVPLLSDECFLVRAGEQLAWSWCSAADGRTTLPTEDFPHPAATWTKAHPPAHPAAAAVLSHMSTEASCSQEKSPASPHGWRKVSQPWSWAKHGDDCIYTSSKGDRDERSTHPSPGDLASLSDCPAKKEQITLTQ